MDTKSGEVGDTVQLEVFDGKGTAKVNKRTTLLFVFMSLHWVASLTHWSALVPE